MPDWLSARDIKYFHRELILEHGGLPGLKDEGALESTLARPRNFLAYTPDASLARLAAAYGFGFARNHVFADGNKRIALAAINVFLQINGANLDLEEAEAVIVMNDFASGRIDEDLLAAWISQHAVLFELDAD